MNMNTANNEELNRWVVSTLDQSVSDIGIHDVLTILPNEIEVKSMRRSRHRGIQNNFQTMSLVDTGELLTWELGFATNRPLRRRRRGGSSVSGEVLKQIKFEKLEPNQITGFLTHLDENLTPHQGLRKLRGKSLVRNATIPQKGRILLFIHGTFSNNDTMISNIISTPEGTEFLKHAQKHYKNNIFAFDHPTLSVSPVHNALDLVELFRGSEAVVDVISHSRGGLVTRWWFEALSSDPTLRGNAILVGCPLAGTGLAAPPNIRATLKLLTNYSKALGAVSGLASSVVPLLMGVTGLMKVVTSLTSFAANTPLTDAAVSLIPGLNGQSRVGDNVDLLRLRKIALNEKRSYYAIRSNFEPVDPGWKFWRYFTKPLTHGLNAATDKIFDAENDLVVDTASMHDLADKLLIPDTRIYTFPSSGDVHHLNYFQQRETIQHLTNWLLKN